MGRQSALLMIEPLAANWSPLDRVQYIEGWSSGYGYPEAAAFLLQSRAASATTYALDGHSAYQLLAYLPADWKQRVRTINYASGGISLRTEAGRLDNLLSSTPAWIVVSQQLLQPYLESSFGRANLDRIDVRRIAEFKKPGSRAQLDVYEVTQR